MGIKDNKDGKILENTGDLFKELATNYPSGDYTTLCNKLGVKYARSQTILKKYQRDFEEALIEVLNIWEQDHKGIATRAELESALQDAKTGALCSIVAKHFAKVTVKRKSSKDDAAEVDEEEEEEEEEEEDISEESDGGEESSEGTVMNIKQRGGAQTINASGHAKVTGNRMTGSSSNVTIHNYTGTTGASTSRGRGKRQKAPGSEAKSSSAKEKKAKSDAVADESAESASPGPSTRSKKMKMDDSEVTDEVIAALAEDININDKLDKLGLKLGFKLSDMKVFNTMNYPGGAVSWKGTQKMLIVWKEKRQGKASILKKALIDAELTTYAEKYF